jgi:carboxylesterase type B
MTSDGTANPSTSTDIECMQAYPEWIIELQAAAYGVDAATMEYVLYNSGNQTESCLVLDVYVPVSVYDSGASAEAPVIVWIHGGGFAYGSKTASGEVAGLLARANGSAIIVSINYRLGMFGWLDGSDVTPNLGFYDQLAALEWVQSYISYFGGSPDKVTAVGESAGASSLLHHLTAYGGSATTSFDQAIIMSPAFQFKLNGTYGYELTMEVASNLTGATISSVSDLTALSSDVLKAVNQGVVQPALIGLFNYGPVVDGTYVTEVPQALLYQGKFDSGVSVSLVQSE